MFQNKLQFASIIAFLFVLLNCGTQSQNNVSGEEEGAKIEIDTTKPVQLLMKTTEGDIEFILYNETPKHRDNFIKLVQENFYDSLLFHRVMSQFMIQGGDPESKTSPSGARLGSGGLGYTVPAEFNANFIHKKGALAAARQPDQVNPMKASSACQFYIVQGGPVDIDGLKDFAFQKAVREYLFRPENLDKLNKVREVQQSNPEGVFEHLDQYRDSVEVDYNYTPEQEAEYTKVGGYPSLDGDYTVFGEVVKGLEVVDKIAATSTDQANRPINDIRIISVEIVK